MLGMSLFHHKDEIRSLATRLAAPALHALSVRRRPEGLPPSTILHPTHGHTDPRPPAPGDPTGPVSKWRGSGPRPGNRAGDPRRLLRPCPVEAASWQRLAAAQAARARPASPRGSALVATWHTWLLSARDFAVMKTQLSAGRSSRPTLKFRGLGQPGRALWLLTGSPSASSLSASLRAP